MNRRRAGRAAGAAAALAGVLVALAGCTGTQATESRPRIDRYTALGDSFTAAPYVPDTQLAQGCLRSSRNYPHLVAARLDATLVDVSCSGARTGDVRGRQDVIGGVRIPPQITAIRGDTDLVTLGIGGNDRNLFATLAYRCAEVGQQPGRPCGDLVRRTLGDPEQVVVATGRRTTAVLQAVRRAAPHALVLLVGYPRLTSPAGGCPAMPVADADVPLLLGLEERLDDALAAAADAAGAGYVDVRRLSAGHEVCSADPWVNGRVTDPQRALAFHPFAEEQQAVADAVIAAVERESRR